MRRLVCLIVMLPIAFVSSMSEGADRGNVRSALAAAFGMQTGTHESIKCGLPLITRALTARNTAQGPTKSSIKQLLTRDERQKQKTAGHFTVHYDTTGGSAATMLDALHLPIAGSSDEYADSVLAIANHVYAVEVGAMGYLPPPSDSTAGGGPEYDIYVVDLGSEYGETTPESSLDNKPDGGRCTSYLTIDNDFIFVTPISERGLPAARVTIAHEFHHAIQMGQYGYWTSEPFFYEITSVWMETVVYPEVPDYLNYLNKSWSQFQNPSTSFASDDIIMYSRSIWATYLTQRFGNSIMREVWEAIPQGEPLSANDRALQLHASSFRDAFAGWTLWNYFTGTRAIAGQYYALASLYPTMVTSTIELTSALPDQVFSGSLGPLSARYYDVMTPSNSAYATVCNLNTANALSAQRGLFPYSLHLSLNAGDGSYVQLAGGLFGLLTVSDPANWSLNGNSVGSVPAEGAAFPNPFLADGTSSVSLAGKRGGQSGVPGLLKIYDSSLQLIYDASLPSVNVRGRTVYVWNGMTSRSTVAASGVYLFTIETPTGLTSGKFALIRK